jgi:LytS/YehU family sensor histidine kinase
VPLSKELKMLKDYITIEEIRYNEQLDINLELPRHTEELYIAPLLLVPFVENCFKHGTSQMIEQPWISMHISISDGQMEMKLVNGKAKGYIKKENSGIGISNVRKRLELIYPGRHTLKINHEEDIFVVSLKLKLDRISSEKSVNQLQTAVA